MQDRETTSQIFDVVIAGAGPVGLFLACELRLGGVSVLVLERAPTPDSPLKSLPFGLRGLTVPTIEAFHRRGLLGDLTDATAPVARKTPTRRYAGHFAGIPIDPDKIDSSTWTYRLPSPNDANMATEMVRIETILARRAEVLSAVIRRGVEVRGFDQTQDHVIVDAGAQTFAGHWLVGCDGGRSIVRKAAGFAFVGTDPVFTGYSVKVDLADPEKLRLGRHQTPAGMYFQTEPGHFGLLEFDGGACHRKGDLTRENVQAVLRRVSQTDVTLTGLHVGTSWTDRAQQATDYRKGRVLLAGDAAHIHAPFGGQGLNLGLGDAMNLGWKLAATIRGGAPDGLLDTYFTERHPIGARVLDWSRAQVALMQPTPQTRALVAIVRDLIGTRDGATYVAERVWNVSLHHDLGSGHPLIGRSAPDFAFHDGATLATLLAGGKGRLLDFGDSESFRALACRYRVEYTRADVEDRLGLAAVLIRPDGIIAWAGDHEPNLEALEASLSRWFAVADEPYDDRA